MLSSFIYHFAQVDAKYVFVLYRSKCADLIHFYGNYEPDISGTIRYFKYLSGVLGLIQKFL